MFTAGKKIWEAATSNSPLLSSKNDDDAERHRDEGLIKGDVSSGVGGPSPLAGNWELHDGDAQNVVEA